MKNNLSCVFIGSGSIADLDVDDMISSSSTSAKSLDFKPRVQSKDKNSKFKKKTADESGYRDRAAERRVGKESDFAQAEKTLEVSRKSLWSAHVQQLMRITLRVTSRIFRLDLKELKCRKQSWMIKWNILSVVPLDSFIALFWRIAPREETQLIQS